MLQPSIGIVIATRHRPEPLRECLRTVNLQTVLPDEAIIVDSSNDGRSREVVEALRSTLKFPCTYQHSEVASAAQQRNIGAEKVTSDIVLFLDDDVILEPDFIEEIIAAFGALAGDAPGGVSGTISNQVYSDPKGMNRFLLGLCLGQIKGSFAGNVLGPAVNFLPEDGAVPLQSVQWLPTTCTAYRREVFLAHRFENTFEGYSFAEDLHLSTRVGKKNRLVNTTKARVFHADMGKDTHYDWVALGESQVRNRHLIMTSVLGRRRFIDHLRLFAYEMVYTPIALMASGGGKDRITQIRRLSRGKWQGFLKIWTGGNAEAVRG